jgi:hypothetical protein
MGGYTCLERLSDPRVESDDHRGQKTYIYCQVLLQTTLTPGPLLDVQLVCFTHTQTPRSVIYVGMPVGAINTPTSGSSTFEAFQSAAKMFMEKPGVRPFHISRSIMF